MTPIPSLGFPSRRAKPRRTGQTCILDKGPDARGWLGLRGQRDLLEAVAPHIDSVKVYGGFPALFPDSLIRDKIALYKEFDVKALCGGLCFEVAWLQGRLDDYFALVKELGFTQIEISENYLSLTRLERNAVLRRCRDEKLAAVYEFGRKHPTEPALPDELVATVQSVLEAGAEYVILEQGEIDAFHAAKSTVLADALTRIGHQHVFLETSQTQVPQHMLWLLKTFGMEANLANVLAGEVVRLESFRRGLGREIDFPFVASAARMVSERDEGQGSH
jgi:phosphosulfolactate synthase